MKRGINLQFILKAWNYGGIMMLLVAAGVALGILSGYLVRSLDKREEKYVEVTMHDVSSISGFAHWNFRRILELTLEPPSGPDAGKVYVSSCEGEGFYSDLLKSWTPSEEPPYLYFVTKDGSVRNDGRYYVLPGGVNFLGMVGAQSFALGEYTGSASVASAVDLDLRRAEGSFAVLLPQPGTYQLFELTPQENIDPRNVGLTWQSEAGGGSVAYEGTPEDRKSCGTLKLEGQGDWSPGFVAFYGEDLVLSTVLFYDTHTNTPFEPAVLRLGGTDVIVTIADTERTYKSAGVTVEGEVQLIATTDGTLTISGLATSFLLNGEQQLKWTYERYISRGLIEGIFIAIFSVTLSSFVTYLIATRRSGPKPPPFLD